MPTAWKGLTYGVVTLLTVGQLQFDRANPDFQIFEPVLMVLALLAAFPGERAARGQPPGPLSSGAGVPSLRESLARGHRRHCSGLLTGDLRPHGAVLSITKSSMVVLWFMHLKFDSRLFSSYSCWACVPP